MKKNVVISLLGTTLDHGMGKNRWDKWRPSVSICQHEDLLIDKYHILYQKSFQSLANQVIADIENVSPETEVISHIIKLNDPWDFQEVFGVLHDFAERIAFNQDDDEYLIHITTGTHVAQICLFLLTESRHFPGKLIQTSPTKISRKRDYNDIAGSYSIIDLDLSKYDNIAMRFKKQKLDDISFLKSGIQTKNKEFNTLIEKIELVAIRSSDPILITGPTGAGKSQLAKRIYELKKLHNQIQGNFIEINCATLKGEGAMSALFGHKKGSFTGAISDRPGLLKAADKGICFLDEIGELGLDEQAMLLRAIEEKTYLPLGSDKEETSNFVLICGTNRNLKQDVKEGKFRDDLLSRINLWTFLLPFLKDRPEDIEPNIYYELSRYTEKIGRKVSFNSEAKKHFLDFAISKDALWQANFRDLNGAITRMATLSTDGRITLPVVVEEIERLKSSWIIDNSGSFDDDILKSVLKEDEYEKLDLFDKLQLINVIKICKKSNSLSEAGRILFSKSRQSKRMFNDADRLRKYLIKFDLNWNDIKNCVFSEEQKS